MSEQEAKIKAITYLCVVHELLSDLYCMKNQNDQHTLTDESRKSIEESDNKIKDIIVKMGLVESYDWRHSDHILDWPKFNEDMGKDLGAISNEIMHIIRRIISQNAQ